MFYRTDAAGVEVDVQLLLSGDFTFMADVTVDAAPCADCMLFAHVEVGDATKPLALFITGDPGALHVWGERPGPERNPCAPRSASWAKAPRRR